jgi:hypothetical protein
MRVASAILVAAAAACVSATEPYGFASGVSRSGLSEITTAIRPALNGILAEFSVRLKCSALPAAAVQLLQPCPHLAVVLIADHPLHY